MSIVLDPIIPVGAPSLCWALDPFNDASDLTPNNRDGTGGGGITLGGSADAPPGWNGSTVFDGFDDRISSGLAILQMRTFMGWAKRTSTATADTLFAGDGTAEPLLELDSGAQTARFYADRTASAIAWVGAWPGNDVWTFWTLVADLGNDLISLYINGALVSALAETDNFSATGGNVKFGARQAGNLGPFLGSMSMVQVFDRVLGAGEIAEHYERGARSIFKRTELDMDVAPHQVRHEGIDWGDAKVEQALAEQRIGASPVDYRIPPRQITIPVRIDGDVGKRELQAKVSQVQRDGGQLKRTTTAGDLFVDVFNATLNMPDTWYGRHRGIENEAQLVLDTSPDFYGHEQDLGETAGGSTAETIVSLSSVPGNWPGRLRAMLTNASASAMRGLFFAVRHGGGPAMAVEAESLTLLDGATSSARSGASGGNVLRKTLTGVWSPMGQLGPLALYGPHRVFGRVYKPGIPPDAEVTTRMDWWQGEPLRAKENDAQVIQVHDDFAIVDFGQVLPQQSPLGSQAVYLRFMGKRGPTSVVFDIDRLWILPTSEAFGKIAAASPLTASVTELAADDFSKFAGPLTGRIVGDGPSSWVNLTGGDADDFAVGFGAATRSAEVDTAARMARVGSLVATDVMVEGVAGVFVIGLNMQNAITARVVDTATGLTNHLRLQVNWVSEVEVDIQLVKVVGGASTTLHSAEFQLGLAGEVLSLNGFKLRLYVKADGDYFAWFSHYDEQKPLFMGNDSALATGNALDDGGFGLYDFRAGASSPDATRYLTAFSAWIPRDDVVLAGSGRAMLGTRGYSKQVSGDQFSAVTIQGDLPRLPPTPESGQTVELLVKASQGDFGWQPDTGLSAPKVRILHRPSWLTVPG